MDSQPDTNNLQQNPYSSPDGDFATVGSTRFVSDSDTQSRQLRLALVVCIYALTAASGLRPLVHSLPGALLLPLISLLLCSALTGWCVIDSRIARKPILHSLYFIIFCTCPVAVPIYLIKSRGLRGLGLALLNAFGLFATSCFVTIAASYVVYARRLLIEAQY